MRIACIVCSQVERLLASRLEFGLKAWTKVLEDGTKEKKELDFSMDTEAPAQVTNKPGGDPKFKVTKSANTLFFLYKLSRFIILQL